MRIPKNGTAREINRIQGVVMDLDEQIRILSERKSEHQESISILEQYGQAEWEEQPDPDPVEEDPIPEEEAE